jgi:energy-converting hydrogenase A subunit R
LKPAFISDCEGPISKNDNAFEITEHFVPNGDRLFTLISKYDDVLADVTRKSGYSAGSTLKLILPFLKAYGLTDKQIESFSASNIVLIANSRATLELVRTLASAFIVSTSYEHYIKALCKALDFPFSNTYCTRLSLDRYSIDAEEISLLRRIAAQIAQMPMIVIPETAKSIEDFSAKDQETVAQLDDIFWNEIPQMSIGKIFSEVKTIGGGQKAEAIQDVTEKLDADLSDVMYVGDSITDVEAFEVVRNNGGLTVSFNGNSYAVKNAELAVLSENNSITAVIAELFFKHGKKKTLQILEDWSIKTLRRSGVSTPLLERSLAMHSSGLPKVKIVTAQNMEVLVRESSEFRKKVRGEAIGRLG